MKSIQVLISFLFLLRWSNGEHYSLEGKSRFFNNKALRQLTKFMNMEADPCDDFYQYACGKWTEEHVDVSYTAATCMMDHDVNQELASALEIMNYRNKTGFVKNAKDYFMSCMESKNKYNVMKFVSWLEKHEKLSWQDVDNEYNWAKALGIMRKYGMNNIFLAEKIENNEEDLSIMTIGLDKPDLTVTEFNLTEEILQELRENLPSEYLAGSDWDELPVFDKRLEELYSLPEEDDKEIIVAKKLPLSWLKKYLASMLNTTSLDPTLELSIQNIPYMKTLNSLLDEYDDEFVYKYLQVRFLIYLNSTSSKELEDKFQCMETTRNLLPLPTGFIYEQQHPEIKDEFPKIVSVYENIMASIKEKLISDKSGLIPESVLENLNKIQLKIGRLPAVDTIDVMESIYNGLTTDLKDFYGNHLKILSYNFHISHTVNTAILTSDAKQYFDLRPYMYCTTSLPYNTRNIVIVPITLLRQPFYHWAYSDFSIYSTLGVRLAQTILSAIALDVESGEEKVTEIGALHIAFDTFFSNLPGGYNDQELAETIQKAFILKSAQYFCDDDSDADLPKALNSFIPYSSLISKLFQCKYNEVVNIFSQY